MPKDPRLVRLEERRDQALQDLRDLEAEVDAGEISPEAGAELRGQYEVVAAEAIAAVDSFFSETPPTRSRRRMFLGAALFVVAGVVVTVTLVAAVEPRPEGGYVTGGVAADEPRDLSEVTNDELEAVVAANPEIIPMRLALARRYLEDGSFSEALGHYMFVLERETNPEALMYVGWMTHLSGDSATAVGLLEQSLEIRPDDVLAQWFLANALFHGTGATAEAVPLLESVIDSGLAPEEVVVEAEAMLAEADA